MKAKTIFKFAACVLCLACCLLLASSAQATQSDEFTYEIHDGKATITGYPNQKVGFLYVPSTIDGYPVVSIGKSAFSDFDYLTDILLPIGLEVIDENAFFDCDNLGMIVLPKTLIRIEENAFAGCQKLDITHWGDSLQFIGGGAFVSCKSLHHHPTFPDTLEYIGIGAFYQCDSLEEVELPPNLKVLSSKAFALCDRLQWIHIPDSVTELGSQVVQDTAYYKTPQFWHNDVLYIDHHLVEAKKTISGSYRVWSSTLSIAEEAFSGCASLTEILLPDGLQHIGARAFERSGLTRITLPPQVTCIGEEAFAGCKSLADIQVPDSVTQWGEDIFVDTPYYSNEANWVNHVFYAGNHLIDSKSSLSGELTVRPGTKTIAPGALQYRTRLTALTLPDTVTTVGEHALSGCAGLTTLTLGDGVCSLGSKAFYGCTALKSLHIGKSLSQIGTSAFGKCARLETITVSSENPNYSSKNNCLLHIREKTLVVGTRVGQIPQDGSVTSIGPYAFEGRSDLQVLTIPDVIRVIGPGAFRDCDNLRTVNLGNGVQVVGIRAFEECDVLSQVDLGQSVHTIEDFGFAYNHQIRSVEFPASLRYLGEEAFSNSTGLTAVQFHEGVLTIGKNCFYFSQALKQLQLPDSLLELKPGAFYGCEGLTDVSFGKGLTTIGSAAFYGCESLTSLTIPEQVHTIGNAAFYECTGLQQLDLGQVHTIEYAAFGACSSLQEVVIPASVSKLGKQVFSYCESLVRMTVASQNPYYHSQDNCIIHTSGKYLAYGCQNSRIPTDGSVTTIDGYAFAGCNQLRTFVVPDQITQICASAFVDCYRLQQLQLPFAGGSGTNNSYLGYIFGATTPSVQDGYIPKALRRVVITGGTVVGDSCFTKCNGLEEIVLPESIVSIGYSAFAKCPVLQTVICPGDLQTIKHDAIFAGSPYAQLYISCNQENTVALVVNQLRIRHDIGGLITFLDQDGRVIDRIWYPKDCAIVPPEVPAQPSDAHYEICWDPVPGNCKGNQTIQLCCTSQGSGSVVRGDLTGDGKINSLDGLLLLRYLNGWDVTITIPEAMDLNNDGKINSLDGLLLLRYLNGWDITLK